METAELQIHYKWKRKMHKITWIRIITSTIKYARTWQPIINFTITRELPLNVHIACLQSITNSRHYSYSMPTTSQSHIQTTTNIQATTALLHHGEHCFHIKQPRMIHSEWTRWRSTTIEKWNLWIRSSLAHNLNEMMAIITLNLRCVGSGIACLDTYVLIKNK